MIVNGEKVACEACIRGHRTSRCDHIDRPLVSVGVKGRPVSQCNHCRSLRKSRSVHTKCKCGQTARSATAKGSGRSQCRCVHGETCTCACKKDRKAAKPVTTMGFNGGEVIVTPERDQRGIQISPGQPQPARPMTRQDKFSWEAHVAEALSSNSTHSANDLDDWSPSTETDGCEASSQHTWADGMSFDADSREGTLNYFSDIDLTQPPPPIHVPEDPPSTIDQSSLVVLAYDQEPEPVPDILGDDSVYFDFDSIDWDAFDLPTVGQVGEDQGLAAFTSSVF